MGKTSYRTAEELTFELTLDTSELAMQRHFVYSIIDILSIHLLKTSRLYRKVPTLGAHWASTLGAGS